MTRRELLGLAACVPLVQLAPWFEQPTPATDIFTEIVDEILLPGETVVRIAVPNTFWRQYERETETPNRFRDIEVVGLPTPSENIHVALLRNKNGKPVVPNRAVGYIYNIRLNFKHIKGLELLLESETPTR
jgi:hypothetical protein